MFSYRDAGGAQRWESCRTLDEARSAKAAHHTEVARGVHEARSTRTLDGCARDSIERYQGTGKRGFPDETRSEYRAPLDKYALTYFKPAVLLQDVSPREIAGFIAWLVDSRAVARVRRPLTQRRLAEHLRTTVGQAGRLEAGDGNPSRDAGPSFVTARGRDLLLTVVRGVQEADERPAAVVRHSYATVDADRGRLSAP